MLGFSGCLGFRSILHVVVMRAKWLVLTHFFAEIMCMNSELYMYELYFDFIRDCAVNHNWLISRPSYGLIDAHVLVVGFVHGLQGIGSFKYGCKLNNPEKINRPCLKTAVFVYNFHRTKIQIIFVAILNDSTL